MKKQFNVRLDESYRKSLEMIAAAHCRSMAEQLAYWIKAEMKEMINTEGYIEELQERGHVSLMGDATPVGILITILEESGYKTKHNSAKDRLELC